MATRPPKPAIERFHRAASRMARILRDERTGAPLSEARARRLAAIAKLLRGASAREIAALEAVSGLLERTLAPSESSSRRRTRG